MELITLISITIIFVYILYKICIKFNKNISKEQTAQKTTKQETTPSASEMPYKRKLLLTNTEYTFFRVLKPICDAADYMICPKVRLEDIADVTDRQNILKWRGYIKSRHVDFILTDNKLNVLAAIELDDSSHNSDKAQKIDEFKNNFFIKIGIPLFRIRTGQDYNEAIGNIIKGLKAQAEAKYDS